MWWKRDKAAPSVGAREAPAQVREAQCPLCRNRFDPAQSAACAHCPRMFRSCGMVVCPRCSHEFPRV